MRKLTMLIVTTIMALALLTTGTAAASVYTTHTVQSGESAWLIAQNYGVEVSALVNANGLSQNGSLLYPGQTLLVDDNARSNPNGNYTVRSGDTLYRLAQQYNTTVAALQRDNGLTTHRLYIGQRLLVPAAAPSPSVSLSNDELTMLAKMIYAEARGESYQGQVAVGAVIMNRLASSKFPNTMSGVLFQENQFTAVSDGQYWLTPDSTALAAANEAAAGSDPSNGALYYWNPAKSNSAYLNSLSPTATIGSHVFAK